MGAKRQFTGKTQVDIESAVRQILSALVADSDREGLKETPARVAKMMMEIYAGEQFSNAQLAEMFNKTFEDDCDEMTQCGDLVIIKDIPAFSNCEHHMALMYNMNISVAYIPKGKVIGLSKVARIADMVCRRLQLQERIGKDIAEIMTMVTGSTDVAVLIEGEHSCMTARGIKKPGTKTLTSTLRGAFMANSSLKAEALSLLTKN